MEEYSTEEEEEEEEEERIDFRSVDTVRPTSWGDLLCALFCANAHSCVCISACDFLGGRLATLFGLTVPKYQYAIDEYDRRQEEDSSDEEGQEMPEMAEIQTEKQHLPTQSAEYGTISLKDRPAQYGDDCHMSSETHQSHET
ncbi:hypothetical protein XENTR_v10013246 [Xenopus tropicalis]|nr:hypothetical protein XENTR_v10013246 [Xenopus tropicalis]